ncbi:hypothetical protein LSH36_681g03011 [Paralvinella palmiformis]|uniref:G-protein coupled receptors family 1 profile domain-containing protein n=1 Tax=Paralvinella palmiformis TaxID=53620 RepID=A0AAD9MVK5_9ANNE|nr:hypothetical protein LSH36_681g03011 [Paralvinella palmiformis]
MILLAVVGNVVMILAVLKTPYLRTVTNLFTINLAVSDLGIALLVMPMFVASMALGRDAVASPIPVPLCEATAFVTILLLLVSIATLSGISLDRYFSICHPLRYPREVTPRRVYGTIVYVWIQSVLLSASPLAGWGRYKFRPQTIPICNPEWTGDVGFSAFLAIVGLIIPFSAMLFSYIRIIQEARKQSKRIENIQLRLVTPAEFCADASLLRASESGSPDSSRRPSLLEWIKGRSTVNKQVKSYTTTFSRNLKTLKTVFIVVGG